MSVPSVAVVCDYREENWPSMDLVADMLLDNLQREHRGVIEATRLAPLMRRRFTGNGRESGTWLNADRLLNRFWDYPRFLRRRRASFDLFHIIDHSYAQLVHELPPEKTIITCHDLDAFRCLFSNPTERRSALFRKMAGRIMSGFRRAARVVCVSAATRDELLAHELVAPERVRVIPNGVHPACSPEADALADAEATRWLGPLCEDAPDLLHVGSTVERKRIDVLLQVFAALEKEFPRARLIRVGGNFTSPQMRLAEQLNIARSIIVLPHLDSDVLAAVYRRADVVLQPSEREGFGLPVVEALACGTPVIASDLPVLREVGGRAVVYCPVNHLQSWTKAVVEVLIEKSRSPQNWRARREAGIRQAAQFSWAEHARRMVGVYQEVLQESD